VRACRRGEPGGYLLRRVKELSHSGGHSRDARLTAVNFVADAVNRALDLKEIADNALHGVLAVMRLMRGGVYLAGRAARAAALRLARVVGSVCPAGRDDFARGGRDH